MNRLSVRAGCVAFIVVLIVGAGAILLFGDQRYHTVVLAPELTNGWTRPTPPMPKPKTAHNNPTQCRLQQRFPLQCELFPPSFPIHARAQYEDSGVRVLLMGGDLLQPNDTRTGEWAGFTNSALKNRILLQISVWSKSSSTRVLLKRSKSRCADSGGKPLTKPIRFYRYTMMRMLPSATINLPETAGFQMGALVISSDPGSTRYCNLNLQNAIISSSGRKIPEARFSATPIAYYQPIF